MTASARPRGNRALFALLVLFLAGFFAIVGVSWLIAGMLDDVIVPIITHYQTEALKSAH